MRYLCLVLSLAASSAMAQAKFSGVELLASSGEDAVKIDNAGACLRFGDGTCQTTAGSSGGGSDGGVVFWTGTATQGADSLFTWDFTGHQLGLGVKTPKNQLDVAQDAGIAGNVWIGKNLTVVADAGVGLNLTVNGNIAMPGTTPTLTTTDTSNGLKIKSSVTNGNTGVQIDTTSTLTSGDLFVVDNNASPVLDITPNTSIFTNSVTLSSGNLQVSSGTTKLSGNTIMGATGTPLDLLNLQSGSGGAGLRMDNFGAASDTSYIEFLKSFNGTVSAPAAPVSGDNLAAIFFDGYTGTSTNAVRGGKILAAADGNWSGSSAPTSVQVFTTASGATNGGEVFRWSSAGDSVLASGKKLCLDGTGCTKYMSIVGGNITANGDPFVASGNITANGGQYSNAVTLRAGGTSSVSLLSQAASGGTSIISDTTTNFSAGKLHSFRNNTVEKAYVDFAGSMFSNVADPVPAVHAAQTGAAVAIEFGSKTLSTGAGTVTFATAFSVAPICVCDDSTAVLGSQCSTSTSTLTITGTGSDVIKYICMGAR